MHYTKIKKRFYDPEISLWNSYVFYISDEVVDRYSSRFRFFSYMNLLAMAEIVIKNDQIIKNRRLDLEETLDSLLGI